MDQNPVLTQLLSLPDETLLREIFPYLPVEVINNLCPLHSRLANICNTEYLWQVLIQRDFHRSNKPEGMSWRQAYQFFRTYTNPLNAANALEQLKIGNTVLGLDQASATFLKNMYPDEIVAIDFTDFTGKRVNILVHRLRLYDTATNTYRPITSLDQIRYYQNGQWRAPNQEEAQRLNGLYNQISLQGSAGALFPIPQALLPQYEEEEDEE